MQWDLYVTNATWIIKCDCGNLDFCKLKIKTYNKIFEEKQETMNEDVSEIKDQLSKIDERLYQISKNR